MSVDTIYTRLNNGESTAVVGEPHVGKTSLLAFVADDRIKRRSLDTAKQQVFIEISCLSLPVDFKPADFWSDIILQLEPHCKSSETVLQHIGLLKQANFGSYLLERFFGKLNREGYRVVLLLDEFDVLLHHPNFNTAEFFGALRTNATNVGGLALIIASRLGVAEINRRTAEINPVGSPFLNNFATERLYPLNRGEVDGLIDYMLGDSPIIFSRDDRAFVHRVAGGHPFLVQAASAAMFQQIAIRQQGSDRYTAASRRFYDSISHHFSDLWRYFDSNAQAALVLLTLGELEGKIQGRDFNIQDLQDLDWYEPELRKLADTGIVESEGDIPWTDLSSNFVRAGERRWRVAPASFIWWVALELLPKTRRGQEFEKWLHDREYEGVFTNKTRDKLLEMRQHIPTEFKEISWKLIRGFIAAHAGFAV